MLASSADSSRKTASPQKATTVTRHQSVSLVNLDAQSAGHQSYMQATGLQAEWQNPGVSTAAQGLKDAQHPFSERLFWAKSGIQRKQQPSSRSGFRAVDWETEEVPSQFQYLWGGWTLEGLGRGQDPWWPFPPKYFYVDIASSANPAQAPEDCILPPSADPDLKQTICATKLHMKLWQPRLLFPSPPAHFAKVPLLPQ